MAQAYKDENAVSTLIASSNVDGSTPVRIYADPVTHRLLVDLPTGSGTVSSVSVATANGFSGTVTNPTTTPEITITTSIGAGNLPVSNGTGFEAATLTGTGAVVLSNKPTFLGTIQTVTAMAAQAMSGASGNVFTRTLAGSEVFTQSNFSTGQCFMVEVKQGSGTSYTVTWFAGITWVTPGATAPVQTVVSNGFTTYGFRCTGTNTFLGYLVGTN